MKPDAETAKHVCCRRMLAGLGLALGVFGVAHVARVLPPRAIRNDFAHYYISSHLLLSGGDVYSTPLEPEYARWGFRYDVAIPRATNPPLLVGIFAPFAALPPRVAFWAWASLEIVCVGYLLVEAWRATSSTLSVHARSLMCGAIIASAPVYWHFIFSQCQLLIAAMILAAYKLLRNGKPELACLVITTAAWMKFFPAVLLPWCLWRASSDGNRRWKCVGVTVVWSVGVVLATGWGSWEQFWANGIPVLRAWAMQQRHFNFTVPSFVKNAAWLVHGFRPDWAGLEGWMATGMLVGLALIVLAYGLCWWTGRGKKNVDLDLEFGLLSVAMLAGITEAWGHYFVILVFPAAVAVSRIVQRPASGQEAILAVALVMLNVMTSWRSPRLEFAFSYVPLYGLLLLGAFFVREMLSGSGRAPGSTMSVPRPL